MDPPEVNRIGAFNDRNSHVKTALNSPMQFFWAELCALHKFRRNLVELTTEEIKFIGNKLNVLMGPATALTNRKGEEASANYVSGEFLNTEPARMAPLICGGSTVWGKPAGTNDNGVEMVEIFSFPQDFQFFTPTFGSLLDPRVLWLTAIYETGKVLPFTTLGAGVGVPYPLITAEPYYYPRGGLQEYGHDELHRSQYVPMRSVYP
jgi:hypothetical protein